MGNEIQTKTEFEQLQDLFKLWNNEMYQKHRELNYAKQQVRLVKDQLQKICEHEWEYIRTDPCQTNKQCKKCGSYI